MGWGVLEGVLVKRLAHTVSGSHQPSSLHGSQACYERMRHPSRSGRYSFPLWSRRLSTQASSQGRGGSATPCLFQRDKSGKILGSSIQAFAFPFHFVPLPCRCPFSFHTYSPIQGIRLAVICAIFSPRCLHGLLLPWLLYLREQASRLSSSTPLVLIICLSYSIIYLCIHGSVSCLLYSRAFLRQSRNSSCSVPSTETFAWHELGNQYIMVE